LAIGFYGWGWDYAMLMTAGVMAAIGIILTLFLKTSPDG
jgi:hypothetical protein